MNKKTFSILFIIMLTFMTYTFCFGDEKVDNTNNTLTTKQIEKLVSFSKENDVGSHIEIDNYYASIDKTKGNYRIIYLSNRNNNSDGFGLLDIKNAEIVIPFEYTNMYFFTDDRILATKKFDDSTNVNYEINYLGNVKQLELVGEISSVDNIGYITTKRPIEDEKLIELLKKGQDHRSNGGSILTLYDKNYNIIIENAISVDGVNAPVIHFIDDFAIINLPNYDANSKGFTSSVIDRSGKMLFNAIPYNIDYAGYGKFLVTIPDNDYSKYVYYYIDASGNKINNLSYKDIRRNPNDWALNDVENATDVGITGYKYDYYEYYNLNWNTTRQQFCELTVNLYTVIKGEESLPDVTAASPFLDTNNSDVKIAYELAIVNGREDGNFDPYGYLTREEAATMLSRLAKLLEIEENELPLTFKDENRVSSFAKKSVENISAIKDEHGNRIMSGTSKDEFSPKASYTVEQAIVTMNRLYSCYNK